MLNNKVFYNGIIKKTIIAFGSLFSNIYIVRKENVQKIQVPIAYANKEKWIVRTEQDPTLENHTYVTMPRMSFEITGYSYDSTRKMAKMQKIVCNKDTTSKFMFSPVPYNLDFQLNILTKTQEDALQIIEQILPNFGPEYTVSINAIPEMNIIQDIPITLRGVSFEDSYDGSFDRRTVIHTLTFGAKINLYNNVSDNKLIYTSIANVEQPSIRFTAEGDPETFEIVSETWE
jgi:hypothetical protein